MGPLLSAFLVYYLILFVVNFLVVSQGQDTLYDEVPAGIGWKVALGSLLLTVALTYAHSSFATMFTENIGTTVIQAILWFGVFTLVYRFQPWHALGIGLATMLIVTALATMAVDSLLNATPSNRFQPKQIAPPPRRPVYGPTLPQPTDAPAAQ